MPNFQKLLLQKKQRLPKSVYAVFQFDNVATYRFHGIYFWWDPFQLDLLLFWYINYGIVFFFILNSPFCLPINRNTLKLSQFLRYSLGNKYV